MKRLRIYLLVCLCMLGIFLVSCNEIPDIEVTPEPTMYSVTFVSEGKTYERNVTQALRVADKPKTDPTKPNHKFIGWYVDEEGTEAYDFTKPIIKSITLYARFELDLGALAESINNSKYSIVKVKNESYNMDGETKTESVIENGIGYIFNISGGYCYVVTNNHTISIQNGYSKQRVTVEDYTGAVHDTYFYKSPNKPQRAASNQYDLAIVCFEYNRNDLRVANLKNNTPQAGNVVVSVGSTSGNVAHGTISKIEPNTSSSYEEYLSSVKFDVICHNAVPNDDRNESILFDLDMNVVGITYDSGDGVAYAISYAKIQEFLYEYVYN